MLSLFQRREMKQKLPSKCELMVGLMKKTHCLTEVEAQIFRALTLQTSTSSCVWTVMETSCRLLKSSECVSFEKVGCCLPCLKLLKAFQRQPCRDCIAMLKLKAYVYKWEIIHIKSCHTQKKAQHLGQPAQPTSSTNLLAHQLKEEETKSMCVVYQQRSHS